MDKSFVLSTAENIWKLIQQRISIPLSWGLESPRPIIFKDMACLAFDVNGFLYQGSVIVAYNEGVDLFEIILKSEKSSLYEVVHTDVYCDQLVSLLDTCIETSNDQSDDYEKKVNEFFKQVLVGE